MIIRFLSLFSFFFFSGLITMAQPQVPSKMDFAGMELHISDGARKQIQADVDALHRHPDYFNKKLARVQMYFPIIERIMKEENLPEDFKYLVIQESALISDAVSSSNAIGFWQFKVPAAREVGLRVDHVVDERMNIVSSTRGAAKYLKTNNVYFKNWIYALMAYQTGRGGAQKYVKKKYIGARRMDIDQHTYWYVKKFLAHKVAFESELRKSDLAPYALMEYEVSEERKLKQIAQEYSIDPELLESYNKCFKKGYVPSDKTYAVVLPMKPDEAKRIAGRKYKSPISGDDNKDRNFNYSAIVKKYDFANANHFPVLKKDGNKVIEVNRRDGTIASSRQTIDMLALEGGVSVEKFLSFNDMTGAEHIIAGKPYYYQRKRNKALSHYHVVLPGETLWDISQKYGVKLKSLMRKNRLEKESDIKTGLLLWLRHIRPASTPPEYREIPTEYLNKDNTTANQTASVSKQVNTTTTKSTTGTTSQPSAIQEEPEAPTYIPDNVQVSASNEDYTEHTVLAGETLYGISKQYGVSHERIVFLNNLDDNLQLQVGSVLKIPVPKTTETAHDTSGYIIHIVKPEETLYGIARMYEVSVKELMEWNNKNDFAIKPLQQLKIMKQ